MRNATAAIGLQGRVAVVLTGVGDDLGVLTRGEVRTRESQPYHEAQGLPLQDAERLISEAADAAAERAARDLRQLVALTADAGCEVVAAGLIIRDYKLPHTLSATLRSHPACHA